MPKKCFSVQYGAETTASELVIESRMPNVANDPLLIFPTIHVKLNDGTTFEIEVDNSAPKMIQEVDSLHKIPAEKPKLVTSVEQQKK